MEPPGGSRAIVLEGVVKRFGHKTVLRGVTLSIGDGDKVAVAGPNGAGKTTLLRVASGLLEPDEGRVERRGRAIYVPELDFLPRLTRVSEWFRMHGCSLGDVEELLGRGAAEALAPLWGRPAALMSKGQRRLAGVLAALCHASMTGSAVLLDEPFSGLAEGYRGVVAEAVARARAAVVSTVHGLGEAAVLGERLYWLEEGRLAPVEARGLRVRLKVEAPGGGVEESVKGYEEALAFLHNVLVSGFRGVRRLCLEPAG